MSPVVLPDAKARQDALSLDSHALVMAPAGSGKTGLLVHRLLRALAVVEAPEQVVAITFTRKAAAEVSARVLETLRAASEPSQVDSGDEHARALRSSALAVLAQDTKHNWQLLDQPARLNALTIDAFCSQLAAQLPLLSGLGGHMAVSDDARGLYLEAISKLFEEIEDASVPEEDRAALARILRLYGNRLDRLIEPLSDLLAVREHWIKAAAAGDDASAWAEQDRLALSGLIDSTLTAFGACLDATEKTSLVSIFSEGSAHSEMLAWGKKLSVWPEQDQAQLRNIASALLTKDGELRKKKGIDKRCGFLPKTACKANFQAFLETRDGDQVLVNCALAVRNLPDSEISPEASELRSAWLRVLRRLAAHLRVIFAAMQQADFGQLAQSALHALRPGGGYGDALLRSEGRLMHLLVDEMQDTSETQLRLIESLTASWTPGDGRSLFLVGDPQQSIYAFRKAEVRLFLGLWESAQLGSLPLKRLRLSANFRSDPAVVDWFNSAFTRIFPATADAQRGAVPFADSVAMVSARQGGGVSTCIFRSEFEEARAAARQAAQLVNDDVSVAVLARTRSKLELVIRALRDQGLTPACQDIDPLATLPEVRDVLALARALWHPQDRLSWAVLLRAPFVGLSWAHMVALSVGQQRLPWPERIEIALEKQTLDQEGTARLLRLRQAIANSAEKHSVRANLADRSEAVWHALAGAASCSRGALDDVRQALRCLREETRGGGIRDMDALKRRLEKLYAAPRTGQVQLMTVHKAKGLEFDHVLLVGCNSAPRSEDKPALHLAEFGGAQLLLPRPDEAWPEDHPAHRSYDFLHDLHVASRQNEALRVLYVAMTRARRSASLFLSAEADANDAPKIKAHSFAAMLMPLIEADLKAGFLQAPAAPVAGEISLEPPQCPRLPLDYVPPEDRDLYRPLEMRTLRPSEAVLQTQEDPEARRDEGDLYAQLLGTMYHEAMQRIAEEGIAAWSDAGVSRKAAMSSGLRRRGMPEPLVQAAVERVIALLKKTLESEIGRWLLSAKIWARSEYPLAGLRDGRWVSAVIDRCFEDDKGLLWVIDYKTAVRAIEADEHVDYVESSRRKYGQQIKGYVELLAELRPDKQIRGALYLAEVDHLVLIEQ